MKQHTIHLTALQRKRLQVLTQSGEAKARVIKRALVLLKSDEGLPDSDIAAHLKVSVSTIERRRRFFCAEGLEWAVFDAMRPGVRPALNDQQEAYLVAIACSDPPEGRTHWTIELLRERLIKDTLVDSVSVGTIHARLTERGIKPWREKNVVHPESR